MSVLAERNTASPTAAVLGEIGLPAPIAQLASRPWDAIIVGAGHNGLACSAYLARAGKRVLVLESRARVGELLFNRIRCRCLQELAEARPGVGKAPGRYLDAKAV